MFGYIRAYKPEMRIKEYELYKAVYCSLCRELGKSYGLFARFTLSYDFTFLSILSMSLNDKCCSTSSKRCAFNPAKKCTYVDDVSELEFTAATAMIMLYYKLLDNIQDEKGVKKLSYMLLKPLFSSARKKAAAKFPETDAVVADYIDKQQKLEAELCDDLDTAAEPTAECMSKILMTLSNDANAKRCLSRVGYSIGRYIYILDAATDLEEDIKQGKYNPLKGKNLSNEDIAFQLNICICEAAKAYELIDIKKFKNILDNLLYLGLEETYKKELNYGKPL